MEDLLIALFSGLAELSSCLAWWWTPWDAELLSPGVVVPVLCILAGGWAGGLSTLVLKHAPLTKPWLRLTALFALPPAAGGRLVLPPARPARRRARGAACQRFWLPLLVVLSCCAARLVAIER